MRKYILLACLLSFFSGINNAQDLGYARSVIKTLCSDELSGRGYVGQGVQLAAGFLRMEFNRHKLLPLGENYFQNLGFPVVTYPNRVRIDLDHQPSVAGHDFILNPGCPSLNGTFRIVYLDSARIDNSAEFERLQKRNLKNCFLVVDELKNCKLIHPDRAKKILTNAIRARGLIFRNQETLVWSPALEFAAFPIIYFKKGSFPALVLKMNIQVEASLEYQSTQNVIGYVKGKLYPDSFLVFTAHYDHLGMLGKDAVFPGANDNASGVAMMLDLAKYYSQNPANYSVAFIAFTGEEAGLLGSLYFVENPLIPLKKISLLLNMDLMSTGDEGMTVVNATEFPQLFENLKQCNSIGAYLPEISPRGKAQNSDHFYFTEAGVPSFFFYLRGNYHHYHDVEDTYEALTLSRYPEAFKLVRDFANLRMGQ